MKDNLLVNEDFTLSVHVITIDPGLNALSSNSTSSPSAKCGFTLTYYRGTNPNSIYMWIITHNPHIETSIPAFDFPNLSSLSSFHLALVNYNDQLRAAINGTFSSSVTTLSKNLNKDAINSIGREYHTSLNNYSNFVLDDYCIIKGTALWTSDFTPPTKYLPDRW